MIIKREITEYFCSCCGYIWTSKYTLNGKEPFICPACGVGNDITIPPKYVINPEYTDTATFNNLPSTCESCGNNPKNGGSGICHCILGMPDVR